MKNNENAKKSNPAAQNSRRDFCKNSALVTGALILPAMQMSGRVSVANDKTLKIALVGCGGRGTGAASHALHADPNVELVAMADAFEDRLQESLIHLQKEFPGTQRVNVPEKNQFVGFDAAE